MKLVEFCLKRIGNYNYIIEKRGRVNILSIIPKFWEQKC